jgi:hypothetical protein
MSVAKSGDDTAPIPTEQRNRALPQLPHRQPLPLSHRQPPHHQLRLRLRMLFLLAMTMTMTMTERERVPIIRRRVTADAKRTRMRVHLHRPAQLRRAAQLRRPAQLWLLPTHRVSSSHSVPRLVAFLVLTDPIAGPKSKLSTKKLISTREGRIKQHGGIFSKYSSSYTASHPAVSSI